MRGQGERSTSIRSRRVSIGVLRGLRNESGGTVPKHLDPFNSRAPRPGHWPTPTSLPDPSGSAEQLRSTENGQAWYREAGGPCNASFNFSNAIEILFEP